MSDRRQSGSVLHGAMLGAGVMMAHQVAGKAARDGIFLSHFAPSALPSMVIGAAAFSIGFGLLSARLMGVFGPGRAIPALFAVSGVLQLGEWALLAVQPKLAAVLLYLHIVALGAVLLSGFWSLVNEKFDPRTAKKRFGQIAGVGTAGGLLGGLAAERITAILSSGGVVVFLALLHLACAWLLWNLAAKGEKAKPADASPPAGVSPRAAFASAPYLFSLGGLVLAATASAAALDFVYKSQAAEHFGRGEPLVRFFALFHSGVAMASFIVQVFVSRFVLERAGLARTVGTLPAVVACGGLGAFFLPGFAVVTAVRALEAILRGSLFRSGYELFYTPVPVGEKRSVKSIIDVGIDRLGDAAGGGIAQLFLILLPHSAHSAILLAAVAVSGIGAAIVSRLDRGYVQALEKGLVNRALELDLSDVHDFTTRSAFMKTVPSLPAIPSAAVDETGGALRDEPVPPAVLEPQRVPAAALRPEPGRRMIEPAVQLLVELRSGDAERVLAALGRLDPFDPLPAPQVIQLLAWDQASGAAGEVLRKAAPRMVGQLIDRLLDDAEDFAIRRRIPRILAAVDSQRSVDGLVLGLSDLRFEVRFQCGRALDAILQRNPALRVAPEAILGVVARELSVSRTVWESHRLLDRGDSGEHFAFLDEFLRERTNHSLEHVFSLLALVLPRDPLKIAFRALHTDDKMFRALALEYLESMLPETVRERLWSIVETPATDQPRRSGDEVMAQLLVSNESIVLRLREIQDADSGSFKTSAQ